MSLLNRNLQFLSNSFPSLFEIVSPLELEAKQVYNQEADTLRYNNQAIAYPLNTLAAELVTQFSANSKSKSIPRFSSKVPSVSLPKLKEQIIESSVRL